jgi:hypothetical protein
LFRILTLKLTVACQDILRPSWNTKVRYLVHKSTPQVPILSQMNLAHTLPSWSLIHLSMLSSHLRLGLLSGPFPSGFHTKCLYALLFHATNTSLLRLIVYRCATTAGTSFMTSGYILSKCLVRRAVMWVAYPEAR